MSRTQRTLHSLAYGFVTLIALAGCTQVWAESIAKQVSRDLEKIEAYQGRSIETGLVDGETVTRDVLYRSPSKVRVETLSPTAHAGELFLYDGKRVVYWWPQLGFGIEIANALPATPKEVREHIERLTAASLGAYAFSLRSENRSLAGQRAKEWKVVPTRKAKFRMPHRVWTHAKYSMPLKMVFSDTNKGEWYSMAFESIDFETAPAAEAFDFSFPDNAIVFRWDLAAEGITLEQARKQMNFDVRQAKELPKGHALNKIIKLDNALPMITMIMDHGATKLSLTQSRSMGSFFAPLGKRIQLAGKDATLSFMGPFCSITWVAGNTQLTLSGNLAFPDMIAIAESVE